MAELALLRGLPRCDSLFDSAYERFQASLSIKPLSMTYTTYVQVLNIHHFLSQLCLGVTLSSFQMLKNHAALKRGVGQLEEATKLEERAAEVEAARAEDDRLEENDAEQQSDAFPV